MPKLWNATVQEHRESVREAALNTVADLVSGGGVSAVSMTKVAEGAGISRATLYKYFPDVVALLMAWHQRQVDRHLGHLAHVRTHAAGTGDPVETLRSVLEAYALILRESATANAPSFLHSGAHSDAAQEHLQGFLTEVMRDAAGAEGSGRTGRVRGDVDARDLAMFALHAVNAAAVASTPEAARALVGVIVDGLLPRSSRPS